MIRFRATIQKFKTKGEKTGWSYIEIPAFLAGELFPGNKRSFRVKGKLDAFPIQKIALLPMGKGDFILTLNAELRKGIGKRVGAMLDVELEVDQSPFILNNELMLCLEDEPDALEYFNSLSGSHQRYFSKWIDSAKSDATKASRIARTVNAMLNHWNYAEMIRAGKNKNR